jgi:PAS domain S-box-containing protein
MKKPTIPHSQRPDPVSRSRELSAMIEQCGDGILQTDARLRVTYVNEAFEELFGWSLEELRGKMPDMLNAEPDSERIQRELYTAVSAGKSYCGEALNRRKDGSTFWCQFKVSPLVHENGAIYGYMGSQRDVTERKQAERALRESEEKFRVAFHTSPDSINLNRLSDGLYLDINSGFTQIMGYTPDEVPPHSHQARNLKKTLQGGERAKTRLIRPGNHRPDHARAAGTGACAGDAPNQSYRPGHTLHRLQQASQQGAGTGGGH